MLTDVKLRNVESDFKQRMQASVGVEYCTSFGEIQVTPLPVNNSGLRTVTERRNIFGRSTKAGMDLFLVGKIPIKRRYLDELYILAIMSISEALTPILIEGAFIIETPSPYSLHLTKEDMDGEGPLVSLLEADQRFQTILAGINERYDPVVKLGGRKTQVKLDHSFYADVTPYGRKTLITMSSLPGFSHGLERLDAKTRVFNYGIQRPAIEILARLALYVEHMAYSGNSMVQNESNSFIWPALVSLGILEEGE